MDKPTLNGAMIYGVPSFLHQLFQIPIAERISHLPPQALQHDFLLVMAAFDANHNLSKVRNSERKIIDCCAADANFATQPLITVVSLVVCDSC